MFEIDEGGCDEAADHCDVEEVANMEPEGQMQVLCEILGAIRGEQSGIAGGGPEMGWHFELVEENKEAAGEAFDEGISEGDGSFAVPAASGEE